MSSLQWTMDREIFFKLFSKYGSVTPTSGLIRQKAESFFYSGIINLTQLTDECHKYLDNDDPTEKLDFGEIEKTFGRHWNFMAPIDGRNRNRHAGVSLTSTGLNNIGSESIKL